MRSSLAATHCIPCRSTNTLIFVTSEDSSATGLRAGWWRGCAIPPRTIAVAALIVMMLCGHSTVAPVSAQEVQPRGGAIIVRYTVDAPPALANGRPWGIQCVSRAERALFTKSRSLGAQMRAIQLARSVTLRRAQRLANQVALCPFILWAEPDTPLNAPPDPASS